MNNHEKQAWISAKDRFPNTLAFVKRDDGSVVSFYVDADQVAGVVRQGSVLADFKYFTDKDGDSVVRAGSQARGEVWRRIVAAEFNMAVVEAAR
jgi:hypothetical protein